MNRRNFLKTIGVTGAVGMMPRWALGAGVSFQLHNKAGQKVLLESLNNPNYWKGVDVERPSDKLYDEFKLKKLDSGYLTYVSGHGNQNYTREQVVQTVLYNQHHLPAHMAGAKNMTYFLFNQLIHYQIWTLCSLSIDTQRWFKVLQFLTIGKHVKASFKNF